jgi:hypothetical protein
MAFPGLGEIRRTVGSYGPFGPQRRMVPEGAAQMDVARVPDITQQRMRSMGPMMPQRNVRSMSPGPLQRAPMQGMSRALPPQIPTRMAVDPAQESARASQALARMRLLAGVPPMPLRVAGMPQPMPFERGNQ